MSITDIVNKLKQADEAYYNTDKPTMSDAEYDQLRRELRHYAPDCEYLKTVGGRNISAHLKEVEHDIPMGSCIHATTVDMFYDWWTKNNSPKVIVSHKVDGSSVEVLYKAGKLHKVITRGDGIKGFDITANAVKWCNLPKSLKVNKDISVRGEAILYKKEWKAHFSDKANPRNAGNGTIMRKSGENNEYMRLIAFDILSDLTFKTQQEKFDYLFSLGFDTVWNTPANGKVEIDNVYEQVSKDRDGLLYEIDGLVVYIDDMKVQEACGITDGRPKGLIAWKYKAMEGVTKVIGWTITQGHTGNIIPTAKLEPIELGGVMVSNVLMTTFDRIKELNINTGDEVLISRAGDVIPYVQRVAVKHSDTYYKHPDKCPACGEGLGKNGAYWVCNNPECEGKAYQRIRNWITKTGIKHLGDELLTTLYNADIEDVAYVHSISDLYRLKDNPNFCKVNRGNGILGEDMAAKIVAEIDKTRKMELYTFIGSLGIKSLGRRQAEMTGFKTLNDFVNTGYIAFTNIDGFGAIKAGDIVESIKDNIGLIKEMAGIITIENPSDKVESVVADTTEVFTFCLTGTMSRKRAEIEADIVKNGHKAVDDVKAGVILVQADPSSVSSKSKKANKLGCKIISEVELMKLLGV